MPTAQRCPSGLEWGRHDQSREAGRMASRLPPGSDYERRADRLGRAGDGGRLWWRDQHKVGRIVAPKRSTHSIELQQVSRCKGL
jgi:hypothetical protein